jgi:hypothetical protein
MQAPINAMNEYSQQYERRYLIGCPVSRHKQRKLGILEYSAPLASEKRKCCRCQKHVYISREQIALYAENIEAGNMMFKCFLCARKDLGDCDIVSLDARPGTYRYVDGTTAGPDNSNN